MYLLRQLAIVVLASIFTLVFTFIATEAPDAVPSMGWLMAFLFTGSWLLLSSGYFLFRRFVLPGIREDIFQSYFKRFITHYVYLDEQLRITESHFPPYVALDRPMVGSTLLDVSPAVQSTGQSSEAQLRYLVSEASKGKKATTPWRFLRKDGSLFVLGLRLLEVPHSDSPSYIAVIEEDEKHGILHTLLHIQGAALSAAANAVLITNAEGIITWVNPSFTTLTGYTVDQAVGRTPALLRSGRQDEALYTQMWQTISQGKIWSGEVINKRQDGTEYIGQLTITPVEHLGDKYYIGIQQDVTQSCEQQRSIQKSEEINRTLLALFENAVNEDQLIHDTVEAMVDLTDSAVGYLHFVNDDQATIELCTWSDKTLEQCTALHDSHYPIEQAGIWADCFRQKAPVIHNDYASRADRKGLPQGHFPLVRHLSVPVIDDRGHVVLIVGVGNKATDYTKADVETLQKMSSRVWSNIAQRHMTLSYHATLLGYGGTFMILETVSNSDRVLVDFVVRDANEEFLSETCCEEGHLVGCFLSALPGEKDRFEIYRQAYLTQERYEEEIFIDEGGTKVGWFELRVIPLPRGVAVSMENVTEEHKRRIITQITQEIAQIGSVEWDVKADTLVWSPEVYDMYGLDRSFVPAWERVLPLIHAEDRDRVLEGNQQALSTGSIPQTVFRITRPDGEIRYLQSEGVVLQSHKGPHILATVQDITKDEVIKNNLLAAKEEAEKAVQIKSAFLTNMSHEIRTPLTGIIGFADILKIEELTVDQKEFVDAIHSSSIRLLETLTSVLDLAMLEGGEIKPAFVELSLVGLMSNLLHSFQHKASVKGIELLLTTDTEEVVAVLDKGFVVRIFTNLISNAVKFTQQGTVTVQIEDHPDHVRIAVIDTGIGISEAFMPDLFTPFLQESEGMSRSFEGTGIGLTITQKLTALLGGHIEVQSTRGEGTTFWVELPKNNHSPLLASPAQTGSLAFGVPARMMFLDDDEYTHRVIARILPESITCDMVTTPEEALALLEAHSYDLVLFDINLGARMNGIDVLQRMRRMPDHAHTYAIAITAFALPGDEDKVLAEGFNAYIPKPFRRKTLRTVLAEGLERPQS